MKILIVLFLLMANSLFGNINFSDYFSEKSLRIEYVITGDYQSQEIFIHAFKQDEFWAGPRKYYSDTFNYGHYRIQVFDSLSGKLIFSKGFSSLFREWQDTPEAKTVKKAWKEVQVVPFPSKSIRFEIHRRDKKNVFQPLYTGFLNPNNKFIVKEKSTLQAFEVQKTGNISEKVDVVFIPDGYTQNEMQKFRDDAKRFTGYLFNTKPYSTNKDNFNIYAVELPSAESGTDIPGNNIWKKTAVSSSFYTFDMERYLNVFDMWTLYDAISEIPHDQVFIIVNSDKYGGSGIYNYYAICSSNNPFSEYVTVHEFGHAFGGLADEYYEKSVTYSDYYPLDVEPWEPNITTLVSFDKKWKNMLLPQTPIPTIVSENNLKTVGVYEGAGYAAKGVYRPYIDCSMKTNKHDNFCPVCSQALQKMIDFYCDK